MLSRAVQFHKLYLLCLLSLGVLSRPFFATDEPSSSIEEFDREVLPFMLLRIPVKPPGSTKALKKISQFNQYWEDKVVARISEYLQLKKQLDPHLPTRSLLALVHQSYQENMIHGRYSIQEFPSILLTSALSGGGSSTVKGKRKTRAVKRKSGEESQGIESLDNGLETTQTESMEIEEVEEVEEVEVEYEEMSRPNKRARRHEVIEVSVDQVPTRPYLILHHQAHLLSGGCCALQLFTHLL
jgi:hypothetical protein